MKNAQSQEGGYGFFRSIRRRMTVGLFAASLSITGFSGLFGHQTPSAQESQNEISMLNDPIIKRADKVDYSFGVSVDCKLSFGGAKQLNKMGLAQEAYLPLEIGMKSGSDISKVFLAGQRAPGEKPGGRITHGMGFVYDSAAQQYNVYDISTINGPPEGAKPNEPSESVPYLVAEHRESISIDSIKNGVSWAVGNDMVISVGYQSGNPYSSQLRFSVAGVAQPC